MILSYNLAEQINNESIISNTDSVLSKEHSKLSHRSSSAPKKVKTNNIFAFDVKFSTVFNKSKDLLVQNDESFYKNFENLYINKKKQDNSNNNSISSVKEEYFLNKDVLNLLNSSNNEKILKQHFSSDSISLSSISENESQKLKNSNMNYIDVKSSNGSLYDPLKENIINLTLDGSSISDISQKSRNYILKDVILNSSPKGKTIDKEDKEKPPIFNYYDSENYKFKPDEVIENKNSINLNEKKSNISKLDNNFCINNFTTQHIYANPAINIPNNCNINSINDIIPQQEQYNYTFQNFIPNNSNVYPMNYLNQYNNINNINYTGHINSNQFYTPPLGYNYISPPNINKINNGTYRGKMSEFNLDSGNYNVNYNFYKNNNNYINNIPAKYDYSEEEYIKNPSIQKKNLKKEVKPKIPQSITKNIHNFLEFNNEELCKMAFNLAKDQAGCRFLQKKIEEFPYLADDVFLNVMNNIIDLSNDTFGNYLIQKLLEYGNKDNISYISEIIYDNFYQIGASPHGTRVIQKIIEIIQDSPDIEDFNEIFKENIIDLIKDVNGNHIVIKYLSYIHFPINQFVFDTIYENYTELATHKHGCCVIQKCIDYSTTQQTNELIKRALANTLILMCDQYGNYVLQYIISLKDYAVNYELANIFKNNLPYLSKQKFSSNVIEKCFDYCDENTQMMIVKELCQPKLISDMILDMYGNYVLQKALNCAKEPYFSIIINSVRPHLEKLKTLNFGQKLYNKLTSLYPELLKNNNMNKIKCKKNEMIPNQINPNMFQINNKKPIINFNIPMHYNPYMNRDHNINKFMLNNLPGKK